jgi:hypothetical protein
MARPIGEPSIVVPLLTAVPRIPAPSIVAVYDSPTVVAAAAFLRVTLIVAAAARDATATSAAAAVIGGTTVLSATGGTTTWKISVKDQYGVLKASTPVTLTITGRNAAKTGAVAVSDDD